jgi:hypothetical protein
MKGKRRYIRGFDFYGRTNDPKEGMTVVPRKQSSMPAGPSVRSGSRAADRNLAGFRLRMPLAWDGTRPISDLGYEGLHCRQSGQHHTPPHAFRLDG